MTGDNINMLFTYSYVIINSPNYNLYKNTAISTDHAVVFL